MFGLPILLFSPMAGRFVDRAAPGFIVLGCDPAGDRRDPLHADPRSGAGRAAHADRGDRFRVPDAGAVLGRGRHSPPGRSSTAQGLFGAAGTFGFIVASLFAGVLAATNILLPFYLFSAVIDREPRHRAGHRALATVDAGARPASRTGAADGPRTGRRPDRTPTV